MAKRIPSDGIPPLTAAKVLFASDRTCCVCRKRGKPVQIHHIDEVNANHDSANLAVLCLDCHTDTQIRGGFHRKRDAEQVVLYRNDWVAMVAHERATEAMMEQTGGSTDIGLITSQVEILKDNKQYELLVSMFDRLGNRELRDKYVEIALAADPSDFNIIELRSVQGRLDLIPADVRKRQIDVMVKHEDWSQLARLYKGLGDFQNAVLYYCKSIAQSLSESRLFSAAYYLKEMTERSLHVPLFEQAYKQFAEADDLWWQVRSLQELGYQTELKTLLISKRDLVEASNNPILLSLLHEALGDKEQSRQAHLAWMNSIRKMGPGAVSLPERKSVEHVSKSRKKKLRD